MTPSPQRKLPVDPAWIALAAAAVVLLAASAFLAGGRPSVPERHVAEPAIIAAPAPDPTATELEALAARIGAAEAALSRIGARPAGDPDALAGLNRRIDETRTLTQRLAEDRTAREAAQQALAQRVEAVERGAAALRTLDERVTAAEGAAAAAQRSATDRAAAVEQSLTQRITAAETASATAQRSAAAVEQSLTQRVATTEQARAAGEQNLGQRIAALEQSTTERLVPLQDAMRRLAIAESRTERLAALDALRTLLDAGQPLGAVLPRLGTDAPAALTRYASANPPTEAALRLAFEDAVRQARGATQQEGVLPRLNSLLTIRRGEEVVWGDASEAGIERARRALDAGDVEGAIAHLSRLPEANRQALQAWTSEAEGLAAARAALRSLAAG